MTNPSPVNLDTIKNPVGSLLWQLEMGVDMPWLDQLYKPKGQVPGAQPTLDPSPVIHSPAPELSNSAQPSAAALPPFSAPPPTPTIATPEARVESLHLATSSQTLDDLRAAITSFNGIQIKRHASNMVFSDGNPLARVMIVGDAPGTDDDQQGLPFCGEDGALLDKMFAAIGLSRTSDDPKTSIYVTTILNWRPPGNRTPTDSEIDISLPLIERHIALVRPAVLVLTGGIAAKALLGTDISITKLRGKWHDYKPRTLPAEFGFETRAMPTYHPSFLLRTPTKKRDAWEDLQQIQAVLKGPIV